MKDSVLDSIYFFLWLGDVVYFSETHSSMDTNNLKGSTMIKSLKEFLTSKKI